MYAVIDAAGVVVACGETDSLVPPEGGRIVEVSANPLADLPDGDEAIHDGRGFARRKRAETADDIERKGAAGLLDQLDAVIDGWGGLTAAQRNAAILTVAQAARAALRRAARG